ncbi:MAG: PaaI family thioesterase [Nitratireductor sp.]|nr:PaaI family thioesterase [Nitratireductor sp.]
MTMQPVMAVDELRSFVDEVFPQAEIHNWLVNDLGPGTISVTMRVSESALRPGGTISGPTMFFLADVTAYLVILGHIGKVELAVTTSLNINFLSKPPLGDLMAEGRLIKLGKRLAVCEIHIHSATDADTLVAQATATYSIPPR